MTDKEIIKALECCRDCCCKQCETQPDFQNTLDLINRQQAEIERLTEMFEGWKKAAYKAADEKDEIYCNAIENVKNARAEAIKEFAERLKDYGTLPDLPWDIWKTFADAIDNLVKEMVGEDK